MVSPFPFLPLLLILLISSSTFSSPLLLPSLPTSPFNTTRTLLSTPWPPQFSIRAGYSTTRLPPTSTLMNAVDVAAHLATLDFSKQVHIQTVPLPAYPDVHIEFVPVPPAKFVETKILVWGLYGGINDIVGRKQFQEVEFDLLWKGKVVAWLRFEKAESATLPKGVGLAENKTQATTVESLLAQTQISNSTTPEPSTHLTAAPRFTFTAQYTPYAKPLSIFQVFVSVFSALVQAAPFPSTSVVKPLIYEALDYNSQISVVSADRRTPPYFQYGALVEGLKRIPEFMLEQGRFAELGWKIEIGGREVGSGFCEWTDWKGSSSE